MLTSSSSNFIPGIPDGRFHYLAEYRLPPFSVSPAQAEECMRRHAAELDAVTAIEAVLADDRADGYHGYSHDDILGVLSGAVGRRLIVTVAGKARTTEQLRNRLEILRERGITDILSVTGDMLHREFSSVEGASSFVDSTDILALARENGVHSGAALNPYQYTRPMMILQHAKMMKKLACGAEFLALQGGWDMKKIQELQWLMREREAAVPVFPRITWLKQDELSNPRAYLPVGCLAPELLVREMVSEAKNGEEVFVEAQLRRLALQITGCRRCGCSGVLLYGFEECLPLLNRLIEMSEATAASLPDFNSWLRAWEEEMTELTLPPALIQEYLYQHLMQPLDDSAPKFKPEVFRSELPQTVWNERLAAVLTRRAANPECSEWLHNAICRIYGIKSDEVKKLAACMWLPNSKCPRHLCAGVCGNADPDGNCDAAPEQKCFFQRVLALAVKNESVHRLAEINEADDV